MAKARQRLRVIRAAQEPKLSQSQLARRAGLGLYRYWQIENGEGAPTSDIERTAVAAALGVMVSEVAWPEFQKAQAS